MTVLQASPSFSSSSSLSSSSPSSSSPSSTTGGKVKSSVSEEVSTIETLIFFAKTKELHHFTKQMLLHGEICTVKEAKYDSDDPNHEFPLHIGINKKAKPQRKFYATCGFRQGPMYAAVGLAQLIAKYRPKYVVSVGVCAGLKGKSKLKDVVFGVSAENYEEGKKDAAGKMLYDHAVHNASRAMRDACTRVMVQSERKDYIEGTFLTGSAVRLDLETLMRTEGDKMPRSVSAADMEAAAVLVVCERFHVESLVIKGVSDMGNTKKSDDLQAECIRLAGVACIELLASVHYA